MRDKRGRETEREGEMKVKGRQGEKKEWKRQGEEEAIWNTMQGKYEIM